MSESKKRTGGIEATGPVKRQRADAASNRERLLASAHIVFAERGLAATLDDVARHAGVGVGTAYRHFPNKQALASEVLESAMQELTERAEAALKVADAWQSFVSFFEAVVESQSRHRGLHHLSANDGVISDVAQARFERAVRMMFERAKGEGAIRLDACSTDIGPILIMMRTVIDLSPPTKPDLWRRYLAILLDGMRSSAPSPAPVAALTIKEFKIFISSRKPGNETRRVP